MNGCIITLGEIFSESRLIVDASLTPLVTYTSRYNGRQMENESMNAHTTTQYSAKGSTYVDLYQKGFLECGFTDDSAVSCCSIAIC